MLNFWDVLAIFILACVLYALIQKIIMAALTAKALKKAEILGTTKSQILDDVSKMITDATDEIQKSVLNKVDELEKKYIHLVDPENGVALTLEKASKNGTKTHKKIEVESDGTVKAKSSNRTTKTKTTTVNKTTKKKKEEK